MYYSIALMEAMQPTPMRDSILSVLDDEYDTWFSSSSPKVRPEPKDINRVRDIIEKSTTGGVIDLEQVTRLVNQMAKTIKKIDKAIRRGAAFEMLASSLASKVKNRGDALTTFNNAAMTFYQAAIHLAGGPTPTYGPMTKGPAKAKAAKKSAPPVPADLIPNGPDEWELYSSEPGAKAAARSLSSVLKNVAKSFGDAIANANTENARKRAAVNAARRMRSALDKRGDLGGLDGEPGYHARFALRSYAALVLGTKEGFIQFDYPEIYDGLDYI